MSEQETYLPTDTQIILDKCFANMRFARATELAQSNRLVEAENLLSPDGILPANARELDLLARIAVRNRRFAQARKLWAEILRINPADESAKAALAGLKPFSIALIIAKRATLFLSLIVVLGLATVGLMATFTHFYQRKSPFPAAISPQPQRPDVQTPTPPGQQSGLSATPDSNLQVLSVSAQELSNNIVGSIQKTQGEQSRALMAEIKLIQTNQVTLSKSQDDFAFEVKRLSQSIGLLAAQQHDSERGIEQTRMEIHTLSAAYEQAMRDLSNSHPAVIRDTHLHFNIKGISLVSLPDSWIVQFDAGLFDRDDHLKIGSKALIAAAAKALVQTQRKLRVEVVGFADHEVPTWPWSKALSDERIGLLRSKKVQRFLENLDIFPPNTVTAIAGLSRERPFSTGSNDNRTVVLRVHLE